MKNYVLWDITPYSPLNVTRRFAGKFRVRLQGWRVKQARNHHEAGSKQGSAWLTLASWRSRCTVNMSTCIGLENENIHSYGILLLEKDINCQQPKAKCSGNYFGVLRQWISKWADYDKVIILYLSILLHVLEFCIQVLRLSCNVLSQSKFTRSKTS
jgi:hypothetical protein